MKVAFCSLPLHSGHKTRGIGFYTKNLLDHLKKIPGIEIQEFSESAEIKKCDVVHFPFFDLFQHTLPFFNKFPTIVTIHDVTPLVFPTNYPPGIKGKINLIKQKIALGKIKAVITDSTSSKVDIEKYLNIRPEKIYVIPLAPADHFRPIKDSDFLQKVRQKYDLPEKFVLYAGNVNWNKNLVNLAEACKLADLDLVLAGNGFEQKNLDHPELKSLKEFLEKFGNSEKIHILGFVPDEDIVALINFSQVVILASFYEGFGLPILEAQACGIPVITANTSSMPEVAGEGAVLVSPNDPEGIKNAILSVLKNDKLKEELVKKGFANVQKFTWEKAAQETIEVYEKAIK